VKTDVVVFVVRPELDIIKDVIFQKKSWNTDKDFYFLFVPRRTIECDEELEKENVSTDLLIHCMQMFSEDKIS
jgi:hypothetical protein